MGVLSRTTRSSSTVSENSSVHWRSIRLSLCREISATSWKGGAPHITGREATTTQSRTCPAPFCLPRVGAGAYYTLAKSYDAIGDPDNVRAVLIQASEALSTVPREFTLDDYNRFVELAPKYAPAYLYRGTYFYNQEEYNKAIDDLTRAIELGLKKDLPSKQSAYWLRGNVYYALQDYSRAAADYSAESTRVRKMMGSSAAIDLSAGNSIEVAGLLNSRGNASYGAKRYQDAISDYTEAIRNSPKNATYYGNRGVAQYMLGKYALAVTDFSEVLDLAPYVNGYNYFWLRGNAYRLLGDGEKAIADYQAFIEKTDDQAAKDEVKKILAGLKP